MQCRVLESIQEVDETLQELANLSRQRAELELQANERIDAVKAQLEEHVQPINECIKGLEKQLEKWLLDNKKEFTKERSRELRFGKVGFRLASSVTFQPKVKELQVLEMLRAAGIDNCIRVTEKLDKQAAGKLPDSTLATVGLRRKTTDEPWWEVTQELAVKAP